MPIATRMAGSLTGIGFAATATVAEQTGDPPLVVHQVGYQPRDDHQRHQDDENQRHV